MPQDPFAGLPDKEEGGDPFAGLPDAQESPGLLQRWNENVINQPLLPKATKAMGFEWDPSAAANFYDDPSLRTEDQWKIPNWVGAPFRAVGLDALDPSGGSVRALGAGLLEGAGHVVEGLTTPLNLATMGSGMVANRALKTATTLPGLTEAAYTTAPRVANVARRTTQALSAPVIASGAAKTAEGVRTGNYGDAAFGIAEMAGGGAGMMTPKGPPSRPPIRTPAANEFAAQFDLPLNQSVQPPSNLHEFAPVDAPTAEPVRPTFNQPAMPEKAPVNPLRPDIPEGQLTNRAMADALVNRSIQEQPPTSPEAPVIPNEFSPDITSTPGGEFVDPNTGEIRSSADAQPGDIVLPPGPVQAPGTPSAPVIPSTPRRARNMILSESGRTEAPTTFKGWVDQLTKDTSGTFDPENLSENLRSRIRDLGLDHIDMQQLPNSIYYYARTGQQEIVDYLLNARLWPNFRNMSREEINPHLEWYVRNGNSQIADWLNERVHERDAEATSMAALHPDEPAAGEESTGEWEVDRARELEAGYGRRGPSTPDPRSTQRYTNKRDEITSMRVTGQIDRDTYQSHMNALEEDVNNNPHLYDDTRTYPHTAADRVPRWNREEMERYTNPADLERYVRAYSERTSPESQAIVEYGNELIQNMYREGNRIPSDQARVEATRSHTGGDYDFEAPDRINQSPESYAAIADQIRGMTSEEVPAFIMEMGDSLYPEDIQPMLDALNDNPTASTRAAVAYLEGQQRDLGRQGVRTGPEPRHTRYIPSPDEVRGIPKGKTLEEVEAGKKKPALERLGKMIGEERAEQLTGGAREVEFDSPPFRAGGKKKIDTYNIRSWGSWADSTVRDYVDTIPEKPGKEVITGNDYNPDKLQVLYRNEKGEGIGYLEGDKSGIWTLAVKSDIGLRRGKVAFEMLKEAFDRGINEPSGSVSDLTRNLIHRVKKLAAKAKLEGDKGELVIPESVIKAINDLIDRMANSRLGAAAKKVGSKVGEFIRDESGSSDPDLGLEKLKEFFRRVQRGEKLSEAETSEARLLARLAKENQVVTDTPASMQNPPFETSGTIPPGGEPPSSGSGRTGPGPRQRGARLTQYGPTRPPTQGPNMPGAPEGFSTKGTEHPSNLPWAEGVSIPRQPAGTPRVYGPTQEPQLGPRRPRQPYVERNPQIVQDLHNRIRQAFEQQLPKNQNLGPDAVNKLMEDYLKVAKDNPEHLDQGIVRQVLGANKALLTSWDLSAPGRQGKAFMLNKEFWKALPGMVKAWNSKGAADLIKQSIIDHPSGYFKRGVSQTGKAMKSFAEVVGLDIAPVEEMFVNTRTPTKFSTYSGIEKSSRAHTAFLSKLRADMFVKFMEAAKANGMNPETNLHLAKSYATWINNSTGRGSLNVGKWKLNKVANEINDAFFAARNMSGQVRTWNQVLNPYKYYQYDPVLRKQALKSLFALAGVGMMAGEVMKEFMGAKVSNDTTSSDFRKVRFGDARVDFFGGYGQFPVAAMKMWHGVETPTSGQDAGIPQDLTKGGWRTRGSVAQRFLTNRLSPVGSFVWAWMNNREFDGKPFEVKRALYERTLPIAMKDMWELYQEDPSMALLLSPLIASGVASTQTYTGGR